MKKSYIVLAFIFIITLNAMSQEKIIQTEGREQLGEFAPEFARFNKSLEFPNSLNIFLLSDQVVLDNDLNRLKLNIPATKAKANAI